MSEAVTKTCKGWKRLPPDRLTSAVPIRIEPQPVEPSQPEEPRPKTGL